MLRIPLQLTCVRPDRDNPASPNLGERVTLVRVEPGLYFPGIAYVCPSYVVVRRAGGKMVIAHTSRFSPNITPPTETVHGF